MKDINLHKRKYVKFATLATGKGAAFCAFLVIEEGGEVVFISEPKILRYIKSEVPALTGEITSQFLLAGNILKPVFEEAVLSPYLDYFDFKNQEFAVYSPRAPTEVE